MKSDFRLRSEELFGLLSAELQSHGFVPKRAKQHFVRRGAVGEQCFQIASIKHPDDFDVTANVSIEFEALGELLSHAAGEPRTAGIGAELGNIEGSGQMRWSVACAEDVPVAARGVMEVFRTIALPYFDRYSDQEAALAALSGDDSAAWLHMPLHGARASMAIGLAYLLGGGQRLRVLAAAKTAYLEARNDFGLRSFLQLKEFLEKADAGRAEKDPQ